MDKKTVFIIEDDTFLISAYQIKFQKAGIEALVATSGKEALSYLEQESPAVILLDLLLPEISGFEILTAIRQNERWKKTPVLVLSNVSQQEEVEKIKALGIDGYLIKADTQINEIVERVKKYF